MKAEALIEHEPSRVFQYSLDGGRTWLTCVSTLRGDTTAVVKRDLEIRYRFRLKDSRGGGTYLTPAATLTEARAELLRRWPDELLVVTKAGQTC